MATVEVGRARMGIIPVFEDVQAVKNYTTTPEGQQPLLVRSIQGLAWPWSVLSPEARERVPEDKVISIDGNSYVPCNVVMIPGSKAQIVIPGIRGPYRQAAIYVDVVDLTQFPPNPRDPFIVGQKGDDGLWHQAIFSLVEKDHEEVQQPTVGVWRLSVYTVRARIHEGRRDIEYTVSPAVVPEGREMGQIKMLNCFINVDCLDEEALSYFLDEEAREKLGIKVIEVALGFFDDRVEIYDANGIALLRVVSINQLTGLNNKPLDLVVSSLDEESGEMREYRAELSATGEKLLRKTDESNSESPLRPGRE